MTKKELIEADAAGGETLHVRRAIIVVERITFRLAGGVGEKRHRGVHHPHVVDEDDNDVRTRSRSRSGAGVGEERREKESGEVTFHRGKREA